MEASAPTQRQAGKHCPAHFYREVSTLSVPRLIPADAAPIQELHAKYPHLSERWLRDLRTFNHVDSWKPCRFVLFSEADVLEYASRSYSPAADSPLAQDLLTA